MARVLPIEDPSNYKLALRRIKKLWNDGNTVFTGHAQTRMKEREIDVNDVQNVIAYGRIIEHSKPGNHWRYTLRASAVDGDSMKCVVEIDGNLIIVTVI